MAYERNSVPNMQVLDIHLLQNCRRRHTTRTLRYILEHGDRRFLVVFAFFLLAHIYRRSEEGAYLVQ